jgi:hypothetical protein
VHALGYFHCDVIAGRGLGYFLVLDLHRSDFLLEIRGMAEDMNCIAHAQWFNQRKHGYTDMVEKVGNGPDLFARHDSSPFDDSLPDSFYNYYSMHYSG